MPKAVMIIVDNTLYMQNQDYLPSRFVLQKETIVEIFNDSYQQTENFIGIAPLCQKYENHILTPTDNRSYTDNFLAKITLNDDLRINEVFERCKIALLNRAESDKQVWLFFGNDISGVDFDKVYIELDTGLRSLIEGKINVSLVLFGKNRDDLATLLTSTIGDKLKTITVVAETDDFVSMALQTFGFDFSNEDDPELALALKLSLEEGNKNRN